MGTIEHHLRVKNYPSVLPDSKWPNMKVLKPEIFLIILRVKKKKKLPSIIESEVPKLISKHPEN